MVTINRRSTAPHEGAIMRFRSAHRLATALVATAMLAPAAAAPAVAVTFGPAHHAAGAALRTVGGTYNINGYNWGGYAATGSFTSIAASWGEPTVKCNSTKDLYAPWVGLDGYSSSTVEQTGVATDCSSGAAVYQAWYEMYPAAPVYLSTSSYPVRAGDSIHASVTYASSSFTLAISDTTRGWSYSTKKSLARAKRVNAEAIIESPTGAYPNFGTLTFTAVTANGSPIGNYSPVAMDPSTGSTYEAHASALSGGNSFSMTYEHE
jgi:hypothetical protein